MKKRRMKICELRCNADTHWAGKSELVIVDNTNTVPFQVTIEIEDGDLNWLIGNIVRARTERGRVAMAHAENLLGMPVVCVKK